MREYLRPGHPAWRRILARSRRVAEGPGERPDPIRRRREASVGEEREHESQQKCAVRGEGSRASSPSPGEHGGDGGGLHRRSQRRGGKRRLPLPVEVWRSPAPRARCAVGGFRRVGLGWTLVYMGCDGPRATSFLFETSKQLSVFLKKNLKKKVFLKKKNSFQLSRVHNSPPMGKCSLLDSSSSKME